MTIISADWGSAGYIKGPIRAGQAVSVCKADGSVVQRKINQVFVYKGLKRTAVDEAESGDIVVLIRNCGYLYRRNRLRSDKNPVPDGNDPY